MKAPAKERLDKLVVDRGLVATRSKAQAYIMAGEVRVNGEKATKAGMKVPISAAITLTATMPYASRGGYKLAGALDHFALDVAGCVCADVGACTGGFTDVMLQRDAARVYALDVGYGQLDWKLRTDERVIVMERTNVRYVDALDEPVDFVAIDTSFISLKLILPAVKKWLQPDYNIIALIKPQFEAGRKQVGSGGIVRDPAVHQMVLTNLLSWMTANALYPAGLTTSSIAGSDGNREFLVWLRPSPTPHFDAAETIAQLTTPPEDA